MPFHLPDAIALLSRTPATLNAQLRDLPETWTQAREGEGSWTVFGVVEHYVLTEQNNWMPRVHILLKSGESAAFPSLSRVMPEPSRGRSLPEWLDEFARLRAQNLQQLQALRLAPEDLARRGRHPALGTVTLSQLLATWTTHDLTHLHQLSRILAHQYREAVGPFQKFLGVLKCAGHSE
jgi:hypothetical protein